MQRLAEILPEYARQVEDSLRKDGYPELADQVPLVGLIRWTYDAIGNAGYIYLEPSQPLNITEREATRLFHSDCVQLEDSWIVFDVDNRGRITGIELLNCAHIFEQLSKQQ